MEEETRGDDFKKIKTKKALNFQNEIVKQTIFKWPFKIFITS